jgi:hypothetical protein
MDTSDTLTMSGETSIAATIFTALLSTSPTAAIMLQKITKTYMNIPFSGVIFDKDLL